ncbi:equilibrative nucleotide transporter 8-like [Actinidia eriantha]|uniref:equilibrative nucleotide transporter 8-like n=1 Tax=Actinidia eriantha TaxID=165200 RepID=UPI00258D4114|nr:equilibrative nucleotide transporter 8-like [Actinidia eriantha]
MQKLQAMETLKVPAARAQTEPRDTYKIAYTLHFLLGAGNLLPWNALVTAVDYFGHLYPSKHIEKVFSVAYMSSSLLVLALMMSCGGRWSERMGFRVRMNLGFSMFVGSVMVSPVLDWAGLSDGGLDWAYGATVGAVVVCGLADGLIGGSLVGSAGKLPKQYMQAVFAGTASSGVLVSSLRIITKASLPQTPQGLRTSAYFYFIVSTVILLGCIVCCNLLYKLPVMQQHYKLVPDDLPSSSRPEFWEVARKIRWPAFGVFMIYTVTLSIFPGFIAENLQSRTLKDWYPVLLIAMYNTSDLAGKSLTSKYVLQSISTATWGCIARLSFYPLFTVCLHGPNWLKTEAPMAFLTIALGLTNGYMTSVLMILTPKSVPTSEAEVSAVVMAVFLVMGLAAGSVLGWFWII